VSALLTARRVRGYLMLEVTVAGAMAAVVFCGLLVQLAHGQTDATVKGRRVLAESLATALVNEARTTPFASLSSSSGTRIIAGGTYSYTVVVGGNDPERVFMPSLETINTDPDREPDQTRLRSTLFFDKKAVTVTVTWANGAQSVTARSRAYDLRPVTP
jgi:hypothetical protein